MSPGAATTEQFWGKTEGAPNWLAGGARCLGANPARFHPNGHSPAEQHQARKTIARYCQPCPMTAACYAWGVKEGRGQGIWGAAWLDGPKDMRTRGAS